MKKGIINYVTGLVSIFFIIILCFGCSYYDSPTVSVEENIIELPDALKEIEQKYDGVSFQNLDESQLDTGELLEFDSLEEFEEFVKMMCEENQETQEIKIDIERDLKDGLNGSRSTTYYHNSYHWSQWAPLLAGGGLWTWKNVVVDYTYYMYIPTYCHDYPGPRFVSIDKITSYLTGIVPALHYTQQSAISNFYLNVAQIKVIGTIVLGVTIKLYDQTIPIGATFSQNWSFSFSI